MHHYVIISTTGLTIVENFRGLFCSQQFLQKGIFQDADDFLGRFSFFQVIVNQGAQAACCVLESFFHSFLQSFLAAFAAGGTEASHNFFFCDHTGGNLRNTCFRQDVDPHPGVDIVDDLVVRRRSLHRACHLREELHPERLRGALLRGRVLGEVYKKILLLVVDRQGPRFSDIAHAEYTELLAVSLAERDVEIANPDGVGGRPLSKSILELTASCEA